MTSPAASVITVPDRIKGLIFDCDGTLVDSMLLHRNAWEAALNKFGAGYDEEFFLAKRGMKETEIVEDYNDRFKMMVSPADVAAEKHRIFMHHIEEVRPIRVVTALAER